LLVPLFGKRGVRGDFMEIIIQKIPLHPPFPKGEYAFPCTFFLYD
jgi:hypothetical protein